MILQRGKLFLVAVVFFANAAFGPTQEKSVRPGINKPFQNPDVPGFIKAFETESREIFAKRNEIVSACKLKPGMVVADVGAGTGLFTRLFAPAVGPTGKVYAVEIAAKFIEHIEKTCKDTGIKNVTGVVCTATSVELPANAVDFVFICDTYHHFEFPFKTLSSIYRALRPGGRMVVVDFRRVKGASTEWVMNHVRAGQEVFSKEITSSGFKLVEEQKFLKENYYLIFEKPRSALESADAAFQEGKFDEAARFYVDAVSQEPENFRARARLGYLGLLANRLEEARSWLEKAIEMKPDEASAKLLLAEAYYRQDEFAKAAPLLRAAGHESKALQLESFKGTIPYAMPKQTEPVAVKFIVTDPLPLLSVRVNQGKEVNFFIDTGAAEVVLDDEFATEAGAQRFGSQTGSFAGGNKATYEHGRIDSLTLGGLEIKNLPISIMNTRRFSAPVFGGKRVDGIIGTVLLYHFLSTIDYPNGQLVLRPRSKSALEELRASAKDSKLVTIPFWMAGDHFMVAWGRVEKSPPVLLFVDTGLAGGGVTLAESVLKESGIKLASGFAGEGIGGGGKVKVVPFMVKELSLGEVKESNIRGLFLGDFPLENSFGFRIGGIISHGFFRRHALTFDFSGMRLFVNGG